jgi:SAM-dependent methyltransferase
MNYQKYPFHGWAKSEDYLNFWTWRIDKLLNLRNGVSFADLGCGDGELTRRLAAKYKFTKVWGVENQHSPNFDETITHYPHSIQQFMAEGFAPERVLLKQCLHHIPRNEWPILFTQMYNALPSGGRALILTMPPQIEFPMFGAAKDYFRRHQCHYLDVAKQLESAGFHVAICQEHYRVKIGKPDFLALIKARFISDLHHFSEEELQAGIDELSPQLPGELDFDDSIFCIIALKYRKTAPDAIPKVSSLHSIGLFACRDLPPGSTIIEHLDGEIIDEEQLSKRDLIEGEWNAMPGGTLLWRDGRTSYGFINHSLQPNAKIEWGSVIARKYIKEGAEITLDYRDEYLSERYMAVHGSTYLEPWSVERNLSRSNS